MRLNHLSIGGWISFCVLSIGASIIADRLQRKAPCTQVSFVTFVTGYALVAGRYPIHFRQDGQILSVSFAAEWSHPVRCTLCWAASNLVRYSLASRFLAGRTSDVSMRYCNSFLPSMIFSFRYVSGEAAQLLFEQTAHFWYNGRCLVAAP